MASITLTYPDGVQARVVDALCAYGNYTPADGARGAFAKGVLSTFIRTVVRNFEADAAAKSAADAARAAADSQITIS